MEDTIEKRKAYMKAYLKEYQQLPKWKEYYREWRGKNREKLSKYYARWWKENGRQYELKNKDNIKFIARAEMRNAFRRGDLIRPAKCSSCKKRKPLQGHHEDYSKPLEVVWLCSGCHADADRELESRIPLQ